MSEPKKIMPLLWAWSLYWIGWRYTLQWGRTDHDYAIALGPFALMQGYIG